jgi:hypothetical protein
VGAVAIELGALFLSEGVLDGQRVEVELGLEHGELLWRRAAQVQPDHPVVRIQMIGDLGDRKVLEHHPTVPVEPASGGKLDVRAGLHLDHRYVLRDHRLGRSRGHQTVHR